MNLRAGQSGADYRYTDAYLGHGIVGGSVTFETIGRRAAQIGLRILAGATRKRPHVLMCNTRCQCFQLWRQLHRWNINEELLPPDSVVRFVREHRSASGYIIGGLSSFLRGCNHRRAALHAPDEDARKLPRASWADD